MQARSTRPWTCRFCVDRAGSPKRNPGHARACLGCSGSKGTHFGAAVLPATPAVRTRGAGQPSNPQAAYIAKLEAENARLKRSTGAGANTTPLKAAQWSPQPAQPRGPRTAPTVHASHGLAATQSTALPATPEVPDQPVPSATARWWLHSHELNAARAEKAHRDKTRDYYFEITKEHSPLLVAAAEKAATKVDDLVAEREATKPPDRFLKEAERAHAKALESCAYHRAALEKAEARVQAASAEAEAERAWVARREAEAAEAASRIAAAASRLGQAQARDHAPPNAAAQEVPLQLLRRQLREAASGKDLPQDIAAVLEACQRVLGGHDPPPATQDGALASGEAAPSAALSAPTTPRVEAVLAPEEPAPMAGQASPPHPEWRSLPCPTKKWKKLMWRLRTWSEPPLVSTARPSNASRSLWPRQNAVQGVARWSPSGALGLIPQGMERAVVSVRPVPSHGSANSPASCAADLGGGWHACTPGHGCGSLGVSAHRTVAGVRITAIWPSCIRTVVLCSSYSGRHTRNPGHSGGSHCASADRAVAGSQCTVSFSECIRYARIAAVYSPGGNCYASIGHGGGGHCASAYRAVAGSMFAVCLPACASYDRTVASYPSHGRWHDSTPGHGGGSQSASAYRAAAGTLLAVSVLGCARYTRIAALYSLCARTAALYSSCRLSLFVLALSEIVFASRAASVLALYFLRLRSAVTVLRCVRTAASYSPCTLVCLVLALAAISLVFCGMPHCLRLAHVVPYHATLTLARLTDSLVMRHRAALEGLRRSAWTGAARLRGHGKGHGGVHNRVSLSVGARFTSTVVVRAHHVDRGTGHSRRTHVVCFSAAIMRAWLPYSQVSRVRARRGGYSVTRNACLLHPVVQSRPGSTMTQPCRLMAAPLPPSDCPRLGVDSQTVVLCAVRPYVTDHGVASCALAFASSWFKPTRLHAHARRCTVAPVSPSTSAPRVFGGCAADLHSRISQGATAHFHACLSIALLRLSRPRARFLAQPFRRVAPRRRSATQRAWPSRARRSYDRVHGDPSRRLVAWALPAVADQLCGTLRAVTQADVAPTAPAPLRLPPRFVPRRTLDGAPDLLAHAPVVANPLRRKKVPSRSSQRRVAPLLGTTGRRQARQHSCYAASRLACWLFRAPAPGCTVWLKGCPRRRSP